MSLTMPLNEVLPPELIERHAEHIRDFLLMEGVEPDPADLGATRLSERKLKELLAELAED